MAKSRRSKRKKISGATGAARRQKEHRGFGSNYLKLPPSTEFFNIKAEQKAFIDILVYPVGKGNPYAKEGSYYYERTFHIHRNVGAGDLTVICPKATANKPCPICEHRVKLLQQGADKKVYNAFLPKERQLWNVIDLLDGRKKKIWDISFHNFGKQLDAEINDPMEDEDYKVFADPQGGFSLRLRVAEESTGTRPYPKVTGISFRPRKKDYTEKDIEEMLVLDELLDIKPYKELKSLFMQGEDFDEDEDKELSEDIEDESDSDDDLEDEFDDEEEEAKPSKKSKKKTSKKKAAEPDEEDEDLDEDEDEESDEDELDEDEDLDEVDSEGEDEDDFFDDEDEDDLDDSDEDESDEEDEDEFFDDEEEDEEEPAPSKRKKKTTQKKTTKKKAATKKRKKR